MLGNLFSSLAPKPAAPAEPAAPAGSATPEQTSDTKVDPLDSFSKLWETPQNQNKPDDLFKVNSEDLDKAVSGFNFTQDPAFADMSKKALEGDSAALNSLLNSTGQRITKTILTMVPHIIQAAVDKRVNALDSSLPTKIKEIQASDSLRSDDARFNHPSVAPVFQAIQKQFMVANPNASASEINTLVKDYIIKMSSVVSPTQSSESKKEDVGSGNFDFSNFEFK